MSLAPKIPEAQKPAIRAVLSRLRADAFRGDRQRTSTFLKACLGDFGIPGLLQQITLKTLLEDLNNGNSSPPKGDDVIVDKLNKGRFATDFLFGWPGGKCDLFLLSTKTTAEERKANYEHKRKYGHTVVACYFENTGDGDGKHPVHALTDKDHTHKVLKEIRAAGFDIVGFIYSDSHSISTGSQPAHAVNIVKEFDGQVAAWCTYLEPLDTAKTDSVVNNTGKAVRGATNKQVFIQTHGIGGTKCDIHEIRWVEQSWCDGVLVQITHPKDPIKTSEAGPIYRKLVANSNGKLVAPFEYSWKVDDYKLGDAFFAAGAKALGDGCSLQTSNSLPRILGSSVPPNDSQPQENDKVLWSVGEWPITCKLNGASFKNGQIVFDIESRSHWPSWKSGKEVNAVAWIGIPQGDGTIKMTSFEFMKPSDKTREMSSVEPGHLDINWKPKSGVRYYFGISNGGRGKGGSKQRTNTILADKWP